MSFVNFIRNPQRSSNGVVGALQFGMEFVQRNQLNGLSLPASS
jgi:hypothetical protein